MAVWSKALLLTAELSLTMRARFHILSRACEEVVSDLGLGSGFSRVLRFPPPLTTGLSRLSGNRQKNAKKSKFQITAITDL